MFFIGVRDKYKDWLNDDKLLLLQRWARNGLADEQIAKNIGISRSTLNEWKRKFPLISDTLKKGKEIVDTEVENALLKKALGGTFTEVTKERVLNTVTNTHELVVTKSVTKDIPPDVTAQIFWLKNRCPEKWRDKPTEKNISEDKIADKLAEIFRNDSD